MVDSAIILDNIKVSLTNLYNHLKKKKIDIVLNNVIFKWLVTLFFENMDESIYLPVMDSLLLFGEITLYKASILILFFAEKDILKCNDLGEASIFFDQQLPSFKNKDFNKELLSKERFNLNIEGINILRAKKFPKIIEKIMKINEYDKKKKEKLIDSKCNLDWPFCAKILGTTKIMDVMKYKCYEKPLIENDYFDTSHNVYKLAKNGEEERNNSRKNLENEKDKIKKKTIIYGNLLIDRPCHKCENNFSSRINILGENYGKKSSLMASFFEACKKDNEDINENTSNSEELIKLMSVKSINHNKYIENILEKANEDEDEEQDQDLTIQSLRKGSWFKSMPKQTDEDSKDNK